MATQILVCSVAIPLMAAGLGWLVLAAERRVQRVRVRVEARQRRR